MRLSNKLLHAGLLAIILIFSTTVIAGADHPWAEYGKNGQNTGQSTLAGPANPDTFWSVQRAYEQTDTFVAPVVDSAGTTYFIDSPSWYDSANPVLLKAVGNNGALLWENSMDRSCADYYGTASIALGTNGLIYAACGFSYNGYAGIRAFNASNGAAVWEYSLDAYGSISGVGNITLDSSNNIYFSHTLGTTPTSRAVTSLTGSGIHRWTTVVGGGSDYGLTGPMLSPDKRTVYLYYMSGSSEPGLASMNSATGVIAWNLQLPWGGTGWPDATSSAVAKDGTVWLVSYTKDDNTTPCYRRAGYLMGIDPMGYVDKQLPLNGDINCGSHIAVGPSGTVYATYDTIHQIELNGKLYYSQYYDYTTHQYVESDTYVIATYSSIWNPDTGQYDYIVHLDDSGVPVKYGGISAFSPITGVKWRYDVRNSFEHNAYPAIDAFENIYFTASFGHKLYSINKNGGTNWVFDIAPGEPDEWYKYNAAYDTFPYGPAPAIGLGGSINILSKKKLYVITKP